MSFIRRNKLYIAIILLWLVSIPVIVSIILPLSKAETNYHGWIVTKDDTMGYEINSISNNSIKTIVDEIYNEYKFSEAETDIFGIKIVRLRIDYVPSEVNLTKICDAIISFKGTVNVSQLIHNSWENKSKVILPYLVPVGYLG